MEINIKDKNQNYLNEYSYKKLKIANEIAFYIVEEFIENINKKMFSNMKEYISKPYQLLNILNNTHFLNKQNYNKVIFCLNLSSDEIVNRFDNSKEVYRYYNKNDGIVIYNAIYYKKFLIRIKCKKMLKCLTDSGKKERDKIRNVAINKMKKLQEELFLLIDNDPTIKQDEIKE